MKNTPPNIVVLYADDLGFGDLSCYGANRIPTPNLDRLAAQGIRFTNAYATAATCTPSRYSLLTGSYPWRNQQAAILPGDSPLIIDPSTPTVPSVLKEAGYKTAIVGKWHLGLGNGDVDWNGEISPGPLDLGFDRSFIMAATNDRVPCVYIDGAKVKDLDPNDPISVTYNTSDDVVLEGEYPQGKHHPESLTMHHSHGHDNSIINGVGRIGRMAGGASALWDDEEMSEVFLNEAKTFISTHKEEPFFLYYAFHQPHAPRIPHPRFKESTPHGPRGDVIVELDWAVGEFLKALEEEGLDENTLVIFSSDNGPILDDGYADQAVELNGDHKMAGPLRGSKYSLYDGGTRVPTIARWPKAIAPGQESDAILCQVDFMASFASLAGVPLPPQAGPDSLDHVEGWLGKDPVGRSEVLVEGSKNTKTLRVGNWTLTPPHDGPAINRQKGIEIGRSPEPQLYNLDQDIGQIANLAEAHPERVDTMRKRMEAIVEQTGTRPGYQPAVKTL